MMPPSGPVLVDLPAGDGSPVQGLLYTPPSGAARAAVLHVHGKGGNFYSGPPRLLPPLVAPDRFVHLAVNLRCHDLAYSRLDDARGITAGAGAADGGMWERLDEGSADIEAAVDWLRMRSGLPVVVVGHSAGGYYLADYSASAPDIAGRIFLSPLTSVRFPLSAWWPDERELAEVGRMAEAMVGAGRGHELIPVTSWYYAISAASLVERLEERPGRWLSGCNASKAPVLLAWGGEETRADEWHRLADELTAPDVRSLELPGTGHQYDGELDQLAAAVTAFVDDVV